MHEKTSAMSKSNDKADIPHELRAKLAAFDSSLTSVEKRFQPLLDTPLNELNATVIWFSALSSEIANNSFDTNTWNGYYFNFRGGFRKNRLFFNKVDNHMIYLSCFIPVFRQNRLESLPSIPVTLAFQTAYKSSQLHLHVMCPLFSDNQKDIP